MRLCALRTVGCSRDIYDIKGELYEQKRIYTDNYTERVLFFDQTKNIGKRADCQDQKGNFIASRNAYWEMYDEPVLQSYLADLLAAESDRHNLVAFKYAYMMEYTNPHEFEKIRHRLPDISNKKASLIQAALLIYMHWEKEIAQNHPNLDNRNRSLYSSEDSSNSTSVETYMYGELCSYSTKTIQCILQHFLHCLSQKQNPIIGYLQQLQHASGKAASICAFSGKFPAVLKLDLLHAEILADYAKEIAAAMQIPVVISIVDASANLLVFKKMDSALAASTEIAIAKAQTAAAFNCETEKLSGSMVAQALDNFSPKQICYCFLGGGVPIYIHRELIGAIGISGGSVEEDISIAKRSIEQFL